MPNEVPTRMPPAFRRTGSPSTPSPVTYCRRRDLPRLIPMWPAELETSNAEARNKLIAKLRRALREERRRGLAGHWTYDLARHAGLLRAYKAELAAARACGDAGTIVACDACPDAAGRGGCGQPDQISPERERPAPP